MRSLQNYKTYTNLSVLLNLMTLRTRKILSLDIKLSWIPRSPFWIMKFEGPLLTYDQMSDNNLLSCTNSLVTIMVVINHRNIPWGPRCLHPGSRVGEAGEALGAGFPLTCGARLSAPRLLFCFYFQKLLFRLIFHKCIINCRKMIKMQNKFC